jgi:HEAT repeat protein
VLYAGDWWAPLRTSGLRKAAAVALRRIGTDEAKTILEEAAAKGTRGIRRAARTDASILSRRERERV